MWISFFFFFFFFANLSANNRESRFFENIEIFLPQFVSSELLKFIESEKQKAKRFPFSYIRSRETYWIVLTRYLEIYSKRTVISKTVANNRRRYSANIRVAFAPRNGIIKQITISINLYWKQLGKLASVKRSFIVQDPSRGGGGERRSFIQEKQ